MRLLMRVDDDGDSIAVRSVSHVRRCSTYRGRRRVNNVVLYVNTTSSL